MCISLQISTHASGNIYTNAPCSLSTLHIRTLCYRKKKKKRSQDTRDSNEERVSTTTASHVKVEMPLPFASKLGKPTGDFSLEDKKKKNKTERFHSCKQGKKNFIRCRFQKKKKKKSAKEFFVVTQIEEQVKLGKQQQQNTEKCKLEFDILLIGT